MTLASGAAAGKFLRYEAVAPSVAAQTAYGIECEVLHLPLGGHATAWLAGGIGDAVATCKDLQVLEGKIIVSLGSLARAVQLHAIVCSVL